MLSKSKIYCDYERAFTVGTGLPLRLHPPDMLTVVRHARSQENPFCTMMSTCSHYGAACYALQCRLELESQLAPKTLKSFADMCETAVPVRVDGKLIAFLRTGQILLHRPDKVRFSRIEETLTQWGAQIDLGLLQEAYFNTRVLSAKQYEALIGLLSLFAEQLASCSNALSLQGSSVEPSAIIRARVYISDHYVDDLSLSVVAGIARMSTSYFSAKFKHTTGLSFVDYVVRMRLEKVRSLLQNPELRISEIAFEVGFQSLSQFNRAFKKVLGQAPREWRESHTPPVLAV